MLIRHFQDSDITEASRLAKLTWGDFYTNQSEELQSLIYEFMVEYYDINRKYSFSILDENSLKAFILAFTQNDNCDKFAAYQQRIMSLDSEHERQIAQELFDYLEACGNSLKKIINENDLILGLFVSVQKGCGKMLLAEIDKVCAENNIKNICLWTDTTCDYEYYRKNNFALQREIENFINGKMIKTLIYQKQVYSS